MGHEEDYNESNGNKAARGLTAASLVGDPLEHDHLAAAGRPRRRDPDRHRPRPAEHRRPLRRAGRLLRCPATRPATGNLSPCPPPTPPRASPGTRTDVTLNLPQGQDTSLGLTITDDPSRKYRAEIFVNGWDMGNYVNYVGPQHSFPVPNGVLNPHGNNTIAIAVWNLDGSHRRARQGRADRLRQLRLLAARWRRTPARGTTGRATRCRRAPGPRSRRGAGIGRARAALHRDRHRLRPGRRPTAPRVTAGAGGARRLDGQRPARPAVGQQDRPRRLRRPSPGRSPRRRTRGKATAAHADRRGSPRATATASHRRADRRIRTGAAAGRTDQVSDLPFLSATNGWGPVERDQSVGGTAAATARR